jgi:3D (Asp-Asp-Asp) domain-containing protein
MRRSTKGLAVALTLCVISISAIFTAYGGNYEAMPYERPVEVNIESETPRPDPSPMAIQAIAFANPAKTEPHQKSSPSPIPTPTPSPIQEVDEPYVEAVAVPGNNKKSLGTFTVTAYCSCTKCCGKWSGHELTVRTQAGFPHQVEGYTIAVDPKVIPLKSVIELEGYGTRYAHDTGGAIKGKRLDLFFSSHEEALKFGRRKLEIWIYT